MSTTKRTRISSPVPLIAVLATAALAYFGTGLSPLWPLAWLAPIPVLLYALGASPGRAASAAFAAWMLGGLNELDYLHGFVPLPAALLFLGIPAFAFALSALALRFASRRLPAWVAPLVFPGAWVAYEFLASRTSPHGTFGSLAYAQASVTPIVQVASLTGCAGIVYLLMLLPSAAAVAWSRRGERLCWAGLAVAASAVLLALGFGLARLNRPPSGPSVQVGLAARDFPEFPRFPSKAQDVEKAARLYGELAADLAGRGAGVVVLPEEIVEVEDGRVSQVLRPLAGGTAGGAVLVVGVARRDEPTLLRNVALALGPGGELLADYDKIHLVPGFEALYRPGKAPAFFRAAGRTWGLAICKDMDFPSTGRALALGGATAVAVPAWDFGRDARLHAAMAVLRGVESGFCVARSARDGRLTLSDDCGRILAQADSAPGGTAALGALPPGRGPTLYARAGDWFSWLNLGALAFLLGWSAMGGRRTR